MHTVVIPRRRVRVHERADRAGRVLRAGRRALRVIGDDVVGEVRGGKGHLFAVVRGRRLGLVAVVGDVPHDDAAARLTRFERVRDRYRRLAAVEVADARAVRGHIRVVDGLHVHLLDALALREVHARCAHAVEIELDGVASLRAGDDIKTLQGNLGHATASFTLDVYGHVTDQMKKESANRMERYLQTVQRAASE